MDSYSIARQLLESRGCKLYLSQDECRVFTTLAEKKETWESFWSSPEDTLKQVEPKANLLVHAEQVRGDYPHSAAFYAVACMRIRSMIAEQELLRLVATPDTVSSVIDVTQSSSGSRSSWTALLAGRDADEIIPYGVMIPNINHDNGLGDEVADSIPIDDMYYSLEYNLEAMEGYEAMRAKAIEEASLAAEVPAPQHPHRTHVESTQQRKPVKPNIDVHDSVKYLHDLIGRLVGEPKAVELQSLLNNVRPSKSKWASTERVGQEELYESCEMVLNELKAYTEHSTPFLKPVSKKEAWNYYDIIKRPMDLSTMTKKLRNMQYLSKKEFADDLYLIWANCMTYNTYLDSPYRKHASAMKRRTTELLRKVPDIAIKVIPGEDDFESDDDDAGSVVERSESMATESKPEVAGSRSLMSSSAPAPAVNTAVFRAGTPAPMDVDEDAHGPGTPASQSIPMEVDEEAVSPKASKAPVIDNGAVGDESNDEVDVSLDPGTPRENLVGMGDTGAEAEEAHYLAGEADSLHAMTESIQTPASTTSYNDKMLRAEIKASTKSNTDAHRMIHAVRQESDLVDDGGLQIRHWKIATFELRNHQWTERGRRMHFGIEERPTLVPSVAEVTSSVDGELLYLERNRRRRRRYLISNHHQENLANHTKARLNVAYLPDLARVPVAVPHLEEFKLRPVTDGSVQKFYDLHSLKRRRLSQPALSDYALLQPPKSRLVSMFNQNKNRMRTLKQMSGKFIARQTGVLESVKPLNPLPRKKRRRPRDMEELPPLNLDHGAAVFVAQQIVFDLLIHAGFDSAHMSAVAVLTDVFTQFFGNLGQTLRLYIDAYGRSMPADEMLMHTLEGNDSSVHSLDTYIRNEVVTYGDRLINLQKKLETAYRGMDSEELDHCVRNELVGVALTGDVGIDLLGLRELDVGADSIPPEVWNRRVDRSLSARVHTIRTSVESSVRRQHFDAPPPWPMVDPDEQIGLLANFFSTRRSQPDGFIDDEARQPAPITKAKLSLKLAQFGRNRPIGTISAGSGAIDVKKKIAGNSNNNSSNPAASLAVTDPIAPPTGEVNKIRKDDEVVSAAPLDDVKKKRDRRPPKRVAE
ncbi:hypothetical protein SeLEV6574_g00286 [Synchytrium endobioticum]|uniref:Bromo domain-containing protein n=1 Tax=Synchytrium endobioticum TaxID=286115 RepID=A0A507DIG0_9FUNG|nr:hypothetical protein SeLEV6574_g00286 [Synchytrium endobioticum]